MGGWNRTNMKKFETGRSIGCARIACCAREELLSEENEQECLKDEDEEGNR